MHITMVKKRKESGEACRKCAQTTEQLKSRGLWERIDEVIWAQEGDPESPGIQLGEKLGVDRAPFFIVKDDSSEQVYTSVLRLIQDRLGKPVSGSEQAGLVDPDEVGGI